MKDGTAASPDFNMDWDDAFGAFRLGLILLFPPLSLSLEPYCTENLT